MHDTAMEIGREFFSVYGAHGFDRILDVGSLNVNGSLRSVAPGNADYVGVDLCTGRDVDIVLEDSRKLPFLDESFDCVVSTSCFEHDSMFWITFLECVRVLRKGGYLYINAPSNGVVHRFSLDCWRFYPDSGLALAQWGRKSGMEVYLKESFTAKRKGDMWNDFVAVFGKGVGVGSSYLFERFPGSMNIRREEYPEMINPEEDTEDIKKIKELMRG